MGAYSTVRITRSKATQAIVEHLLHADDETLSQMVDAILMPKLLNCDIVNDDDENDDGVLG